MTNLDVLGRSPLLVALEPKETAFRQVLTVNKIQAPTWAV